MMGLFDAFRHRKSNPDEQDIDVGDVLGIGLDEALARCIVVGAAGGVRARVYLDDDPDEQYPVDFYIVNGQIRLVVDESRPLNVAERTFFFPQDRRDQAFLDKVGTYFTPTAEFFATLWNDFPEVGPEMRGVLRDYSLAVAASARKGRIRQVKPDPFLDEQLAEALSPDDPDRSIMAATPPQLVAAADQTIALEQTVLVTLHAEGVGEDQLIPHLACEVPDQLTDVDRLLVAAINAKSDRSLSDIYEHATGFVWADVLQTLATKDSLYTLEVRRPPEPDEDASLPDIGGDSGEPDASLPDIGDGGNENVDIPDVDLTVPPEVSTLVADQVVAHFDDTQETGALGSGLVDELSRVGAEQVQGVADRARALIDRNADLETQVAELDDRLSTVYNTHRGSFSTYIHGAASGSDMDEEDSQTAQDAFSVASQLEATRDGLNTQRVDILSQLEQLVAGVPGTDTLQALVRDKMRGIEAVRNLTTETPEEDRELAAEQQEALDAVAMTPRNVPVFFATAQAQGFNPQSLRTTPDFAGV